MHLPGNAPCAYFIKYSRDSQNARVAAFFFSAFYRSLFNDSDALVKRGAVSIPTPVNFLLHEMSSIGQDRKSTRLNSSHRVKSRMPSSA